MDPNGIDDSTAITQFLKSLIGATIEDIEVLQWQTDPEFRIKTSKVNFTLHSNDIGIFIDDIGRD